MNDFVQLKFPALFSSSCPSDFFPADHLKKFFIVLFLLLFLDISYFVDGQKFSDKILNQPSIAVAVPPHSLYQAQPPVLRQDLSALPAIMNADRVSKLLRKIANEEIGVVAMQSYLDDTLYKNREYEYMASLRKAASIMDKKLGNFRIILDSTANAVLSSYKKTPYDVQVFKQYRDCCGLHNEFLKKLPQYKTKVNVSHTCDVVPRTLSHFPFYPGKELTKIFEANSQQQSSVQWQYFISSDGLHIEYPAHQFDDKNFTNCVLLGHERHRNVFIKTALPFKKRVIILMDRGNVMSSSQLETAKCVVKGLISSLDDVDEVMVLSVGSDVIYPTHLHCIDEKLFYATGDVKEHLFSFVDKVTKANGHTNHSLGFAEAFKLLQEASSDEKIKPMILYVSRGLFSQLTEGSFVMSTIAEANLKMDNGVQINTFALMDTGKAVMWETTFLRDVAAQNFQQYSQSFPAELLKIVKSRSELKPPEGKMILINSSNDYCISLKELYDSLKPAGFRVDEQPYNDVKFTFNENSIESSTISLNRAVIQNDQFLGVVGVDALLKDVASSVLYYSTPDTTSYAFLLDLEGRTLIHPKLSNNIYNDVYPIDINVLEQLPRDALSKDEGVKAVPIDDDVQNGTSKTKSFYWRKLTNGPFVVVVTSLDDSLVEKTDKEKKAASANILTYHRLDLRLNKDLRPCLQGKQLISSDRCGLYLSPKCFDKPYERSLALEDLRSAQGYWAYISDHTKLITNPGLKTEFIRNEISDWSNIANDWRKQSRQSSFKSAVVRRYLATPNGIMLTYPAFFMEQTYDPTRRYWYQRAIQFPGKVILTQPILDPSGVGYVVSISTTVFEGKFASMHHPTEDRVVAVMAVDVPLTFLYKLIDDTLMNFCREQRMYCFLFDDRGYVVAHRNLFVDTDTTPQPFEQMHLTHKEPAIASDILQNKDFVKKYLCNNYGGRSVQRYYVLNTSYSDVLRSGDGCMRYQVAAVPNTNVFLAVVNRSCHRQSSFCPCSVVDRKCLNCHRSEPTECECPCECPTKGLHCDDSEFDFSIYPSCDPIEEPLKVPTPYPTFVTSHMSTLPSCSNVKCDEYTTESLCLGIMGCEWCIYEDRKTYLKTPFCTTVSQCYGGVLGYSAYGTQEKIYTSDQFIASTPVGPVAGGIMGVFVVLVLGVLWYRHKVARLVEARGGRYGSAGSGSRLNANDELEEGFHFDDGSGSKGDGGDNQGKRLLLASFERENLAAARPRPAWRRGPRTESSDPGYSTMTGNCDDSEQATTIEPLTPRRNNADSKSTFLSRPRPRSFCSTAATVASATLSEPSTTIVVMVDKNGVSGKTDLARDIFPDAAITDDDSFLGQTVLPQESKHIVTKALVHAVDA